MNGQLQLVRQRGVGERVRAGVGHRTRHVAHCVVDHTMLFVHRVGVRGFAHGLDAATLVDGNVHHDGATLHGFDHRFGYHDWCACTCNQHRTNHQIGVQHAAFDRAAIRRQRHDATLFDLVDEPQAIQVLVQQHHFGFHARSDASGVPTHVACADHHHLGRTYTWCSTHQHTSTAVRALQVVRTSLSSKTTGNFTHRCQER